MFDCFSKEKSDFLKKRDKSKKGCVDKDIKEIINIINSRKDYYTTSSCSGRIVLLERLFRKKNESNWIFVKHYKIKFNEIKNHLKNKIKNEIWFNIKIPLMFHKWFKCNNHIAWNLDIAKVKDFWDLKNALHFSDAQKPPQISGIL